MKDDWRWSLRDSPLIQEMLAEVGHPVVALKRVAFGPLRLGELTAGRHRRLTAAEVERLREAAQRRV